METIGKIILEHMHKYPLMRIGDYVKLIYQNTLGPYHFTYEPSLLQIIRGIEEELMLAHNHSEDWFTEIGNGYLRVDLGVVHNKIMTVQELGKAFLLSMGKIPTKDDFLSFKENLMVFQEMIDEGFVPIDLNEAKYYIFSLDLDNPKPRGHSKIYKNAYNPHYRVVLKDLIIRSAEFNTKIHI